MVMQEGFVEEKNNYKGNPKVSKPFDDFFISFSLIISRKNA